MFKNRCSAVEENYIENKENRMYSSLDSAIINFLSLI